MFKLIVILCAALFLTLLIGGRDTGQARFGLQGAYDIAALKDAPTAPDAPQPDPVAETVVVQAAPAADPAPTAAPSVQAASVTQASFAPGTTTDDGAALQSGLTLSLPLVTETAAEPLAAEPAALRVSRVIGSTVNVREGPSAKSAVLDRLVRDEAVTVISTDESGWSLVRIEGDGIEGYIASRYLSDPVGDSVLFASE